MQGSSRRSARAGITTVFAAAFVAAAVSVFALTFFLGDVLLVAELSQSGRRAIAAGVFVSLAAMDLVAIRKATYCPIGLSRQTPKGIMRKYPAWLTASIWGFDTGLAVTTFRVAAVTWGALMLVFLGLSSWQIGLGYGLGFALPLAVVLWTNRGVKWDLIERLLKQRQIMQVVSAVFLTAGSLILLMQALA